MTIKQVMNYGCEGMTAIEVSHELERRLDVVCKINKIGDKIALCGDLDKRRKKCLLKQLQEIKASEKVWLYHVAWFMYC